MKPSSFILLLFCLVPFLSPAQNLISIVKGGHDSIVIYNKSAHSIRLSYASHVYYIYRGEAVATHFKLSVRNVSATSFTVSYDEKCYQMDLEICEGIRKPCLGCALIYILPPEALSVPALFSCPIPKYVPEGLAVVASDSSIQWKRQKLFELCMACCKEKEEAIRANCRTNADYYRNHPPATVVYRARDLISLQRRFAIDFHPYYLAGFKQPGLTPLNFSEKRFFGFRTSLNFNLYRQKQRVSGAQVTVPFDFQQTPVVFKKNTNASLPDTGYSWKNNSIGVGYRFFTYEGIYNNFLKNASVIIDIGISNNSRSKYTVATNKVMNQVSDNAKSVTGGYFNVGYQVGVWRGFGIFGSYYTTIKFKKNKPALEAPQLRQFNVGLYLNLFTKYSYQY